jgi:hypothetical protein
VGKKLRSLTAKRTIITWRLSKLYCVWSRMFVSSLTIIDLYNILRCRNYSDVHNMGLITVASWTKTCTLFYSSGTGIVYSNSLFTWIIYVCVCLCLCVCFSVFVDSIFRRADSSSLSPIRCPWKKINEPDKRETPGRCFAMTLWQWLSDKFHGK